MYPKQTNQRMSVRDRVTSILEGRQPDRLPFIGRLDVWYSCHVRAGTLPQEFKTLSLEEIHRSLGMGRQRFMAPFVWRLRGVEMVVEFSGDQVYRAWEPEVELFCGSHDYVSFERAGETVTRYLTPRGILQTRHELAEMGVLTGTEPYLKEHFIKEHADFQALEYLLEHAEYVPQYDRVAREQERLGDIGYVVPMPPRVPFQQVLLEYLGEVPLFYALHDEPHSVARLMRLLDEQMTAILHHLAGLPALYVEFPDNLHGLMTNPVLFRKYSLPHYQRYCDILHGQGKKVGSHTDGDVRPLLHLLKESGLDVCESFSPAPLTACTFEEAWDAWQGGPIMWGGIPSPLLEPRTEESELRSYMERVLQTVGGDPIVFCVVDMVMGHNLLDRIRYVADRLEAHRIC